MPSFDVIVIGVGSMGAAACYQLARQGVRVLGLEQFAIPNERASHHGRSRMIRLAYFENPHYVTLLKRAYELWEEIESVSGGGVIHLTGGLYLGLPDGDLVRGSMEAARLHALPHEVLSRDDIAREHPLFHVPDDFIALYERKAGYIIPERAVGAYAQAAMRHGAVLRAHEPVLEWQADGSGVRVRTSEGDYHAGHLVFAAGAWTSRLLPELSNRLTVTRQALGWVWPRRPEAFEMGRFGVWAIDPAPAGDFQGVYYGFPLTPDGSGGVGLKVARHFPASAVDPETVDRSPTAEDREEILTPLRTYLPDGLGPILQVGVCVYTNSPDGHFMLGPMKGQERVTLACGFSGHGFKFVSVVGEILADLATTGRTALPIDLFSPARFS